MDRHQQIRDRLQTLAGIESATVLAIVTDVNESEKTITLQDDQTGIEIFDVRLRPVIDGNEFITVLPKINTWCLAVKIEDDEDYMAIAFGEGDKITSKIDTCSFEQSADGFEIKKGADSLKDVLTLIVQAVQPIVVMMGNNPDYAKLLQALTKINNLLK